MHVHQELFVCFRLQTILLYARLGHLRDWVRYGYLDDYFRRIHGPHDIQITWPAVPQLKEKVNTFVVHQQPDSIHFKHFLQVSIDAEKKRLHFKKLNKLGILTITSTFICIWLRIDLTVCMLTYRVKFKIKS